MSTPQRYMELANCPYTDIPYSTAKAQYGGQVAALMEKLHMGTSGKAKEMDPSEMKWKIIWKKTDQEPPLALKTIEEIVQWIDLNSEVHLKASGAGWKDYEPIHVLPDKIRGVYEQAARGVLSRREIATRIPSGKDLSLIAVDSEPDDGTDLEASNGSLLIELEEWLVGHKHDKRLASIARLVLGQLIESER